MQREELDFRTSLALPLGSWAGWQLGKGCAISARYAPFILAPAESCWVALQTTDLIVNE